MSLAIKYFAFTLHPRWILNPPVSLRRLENGLYRVEGDIELLAKMREIFYLPVQVKDESVSKKGKNA